MFQEAINQDHSTNAVLQIENITKNVTLEWLNDGNIVIFTVSSMEFADIDAWSAKAIAIAKAKLEEGSLYLAIHDVSAKGLTFTPYIREKTKETIRGQKGTMGRTAVVVPSDWPGTMLRLFINQLVSVLADRPIKGFRTREEAIAWVAEAIK